MQRNFRTLCIRTLAVLVLALSGLSGCQSNLESMKNMVGLGAGGEGAAGQVSGSGARVLEPVAEGDFKAAVDSSRLIFVIPVDGAGGPATLVLADAVAASLRDAGQPAILADKANEMGPTIVGRIKEVKRRGSIVWVTAVWELRAPYGTAVAEYSQQIVVDAGLWQSGAAEAVNLLVLDAAPRVSAMVKSFISPLAMPAGMRTVVTDRAAQEQAALESTAREAAIRNPARTLVSAPVAAPQPQIRTRIKGPADKHAVAVLTNKVSRVLNKSPKVEKKAVVKPAPKAKRKTGKPRVLMEIPEEAPKIPKVRPRNKPVLMPVPGKSIAPKTSKHPPVGWARPSFLIKEVSGAPGDDNLALTKSMKTAMRKNDLTVTEDPRQAGFVIKGKVEISSPVNGRQQTRIVWTVNTVDGDEVGKAVQENAVKAGSLSGPWGRVADIVSLAAITGIQELFGIERKQSSKRSRKIKFSGRSAAMPREPGRALPPPR
ncbi:MAG: hypothetical protein HN377_07595 [Alphaproteobacteria bacterium]|nr:hypothetical protein [Alphaproteobacteria bacterium]